MNLLLQSFRFSIVQYHGNTGNRFILSNFRSC